MRLILLAGAACIMAPALANAAPAPSQPTTVQELVVTAQLREEDIEKVPLVVTAITSSELSDRHVSSLREIMYLDPGLNFTQSNGVNESYQIRGVGTFNATSFALENSVATVYDGVNISDDWVIKEDFSDVARVEVLEGPQGLLFGKNASAGLISVITKEPVLDRYAAELHLTYDGGGYDEEDAEGAINVPLGSTAALRLNAFYHRREGDILNVFNGARLNGEEVTGGKAKLLWKPNDRFRLYVTGDIAQRNVPTEATLFYSDLPGSPALLYYQSLGIQPGLGSRKVALDGPMFGHYISGGGMAEMDYDFGVGKLTSISGLRYDSGTENLDTDGTAMADFNINFGKHVAQQYSEEVRFSSTPNSWLDYVVGLYWNKYVFNPSDSVNILDLFEFTIRAPNTFNSYAAFGQGTIHFSPGWRLVVGARETYDHNVLNYGLVDQGVLPSSLAGFPAFNQLYTENNSGFMGKIGIEHDFGPGTMGYATFTEGYKGPGFNTQSLLPNENIVVGAETPYDYEIGLKTTAIPRTRLNLAAFYTDFSKYQATVDVFVNSTVGFQSIVENAGALHSEGVEVSVDTSPFEHFTVSGGLAYTRAIYASLPNQSCFVGQTAAEGCINGHASASGNELANAPRTILTVQGEYARPVADRLEGFVNANYYWRSSTNFSPLDDPREEIGAYGLLGAGLGIRDPNGKWALTVWGKNLLNQVFATAINGIGGGFVDNTGQFAYRPPEAYRQFGITLDLSL